MNIRNGTSDLLELQGTVIPMIQAEINGTLNNFLMVLYYLHARSPVRYMQLRHSPPEKADGCSIQSQAGVEYIDTETSKFTQAAPSRCCAGGN